MAKDVFFENETEPIIDDLLEKYKLEETPEQALKKIAENEYFNGGIILNAAKSVVLGELDQAALPAHLKEKLGISDAEAGNLTKDILEKLVAEAETSEVQEEEYVPPQEPKQNIEAADRMPLMPTAEPIQETPAQESPQPQSRQQTQEQPKPKPSPARKIALPETEEVQTAPQEQPKVRMKKGPDSYREPIE